MTFLEILGEMGVDADATLKRFMGKEEMLKRFILKYPDDKTYEAFKTAVEGGTLEDIEVTSHTLKGMAANLGFDRLAQLSADVMNAVRGGTYDKSMFDEIPAEQEKLLKCIAQIS